MEFSRGLDGTLVLLIWDTQCLASSGIPSRRESPPAHNWTLLGRNKFWRYKLVWESGRSLTLNFFLCRKQSRRLIRQKLLRNRFFSFISRFYGTIRGAVLKIEAPFSRFFFQRPLLGFPQFLEQFAYFRAWLCPSVILVLSSHRSIFLFFLILSLLTKFYFELVGN